jgi:hypothetical protein
MKKLGLFAVALTAAVLLAGCYITGRAAVPTVHAQVVAPPPPTVVGRVEVGGPPPPTVVGTYAPPRPAVVTGVQVLGQTCTPGAPEILNGIDDNCNGQIDEGFVGTGNLQITLGWSTPADLDLYVVDPGGFEISYSATQSPTGGFLDRDARGACTDGETGENVFWSGNPPAGHYGVRVNYYSDCGTGGPATFVLSVAYGGQIVGAYQYTIAPNDTIEVISFDL